MKRGGAPLYFLGTVLGGWAAARVLLLWPASALDSSDSLPPDGLLRFVPRAAAATLPQAPPAPALTRILGVQQPPRHHGDLVVPAPRHAGPVHIVVTRLLRSDVSLPAGTPFGGSGIGLASVAPASRNRPIPAPPSTPVRGSRLSASAWAIARTGSNSSTRVTAPQLGGGQAGVRIAYALGNARRLAATLRVAGATGAPEREAALGVEWRVPGVPLRLFAEQRVALARGRGGATVGAIAGVSKPLPARFDLEGYAQGGVIARNGGEGFVDGAIRASRPVARIGSVIVDAGVGGWGAAQRGAARLDLGPTLGVGVPVAGHHLRLALDWRQRVAGNARPASGPALSLGADF